VGYALGLMDTPTTGPEPYLASNRALWDEWAGVNARSAEYDLAGFRAGGVRLRDYELAEVGDVRGKRLLHLQCHFGIDTLSWARLGADVTGVDFSERAVALARDLAAELGIPATFVCCDVLDLPAHLDGAFDVVYTSRGVLGWLPDLQGWARAIARVLRPGGTFYITEVHPFVWVFDDREGVADPRVRYPYFPRAEPLAFPVTGSYADREAHVEATVEYGWPHGIGEVVTALAAAGLRIEFLHEWPFLAWSAPFLVAHPDGTWRLPADAPGEIPLMFSLKATRT
jgi:SAM-dependent methyltransferase